MNRAHSQTVAMNFVIPNLQDTSLIIDEDGSKIWRIALVEAKSPWFYEIADALIAGFRELRMRACLDVDTPEGFAQRWAGSWSGAACKWLVMTPEVHAKLPPGSIAYNLEQLDARASHVAPAALEHLRRACAPCERVWDFSAKNLHFWDDGVRRRAHYMPLGASLRMAYPSGIPGNGSNSVLFLGNPYGRRAELVNRLKARIAGFEVVQNAFCFGDARRGQRASAAKLEALARAKLVVNIKPVDPQLTCTEAPRLLWCLANRVFVVSEMDGDPAGRAPFEASGVVFAETAELESVACELARRPREELLARAEAAFQYLLEHHAMADSLSRAVKA